MCVSDSVHVNVQARVWTRRSEAGSLPALRQAVQQLVYSCTRHLHPPLSVPYMNCPSQPIQQFVYQPAYLLLYQAGKQLVYLFRYHTVPLRVPGSVSVAVQAGRLLVYQLMYHTVPLSVPGSVSVAVPGRQTVGVPVKVSNRTTWCTRQRNS